MWARGPQTSQAKKCSIEVRNNAELPFPNAEAEVRQKRPHNVRSQYKVGRTYVVYYLVRRVLFCSLRNLVLPYLLALMPAPWTMDNSCSVSLHAVHEEASDDQLRSNAWLAKAAARTACARALDNAKKHFSRHVSTYLFERRAVRVISGAFGNRFEHESTS